VAAAVVVAHGDPMADKHLAAYYVATADAVPAAGQLRAHLSANLPAYMVPAVIRRLDELPLTANGKVDRAALPAAAGEPETTPPQAVAEVLPQTPPADHDPDLTQQILTLVSSVTELTSIQANDNLLELGASSVDMVRIANALEKRLNFRPAFEAFYREPTVAALVRAHATAQSPRQPVVPEPAARTEHRPALEAVKLTPADQAEFKRRRLGLRRFQEPPLALADAGTPAGTRRSVRSFALKPIPAQRISDLLACLRATVTDDGVKYRYASAGGLYPVQTYLHLKPGRVAGFAAGTYYYDPQHHGLVPLAQGHDLARDLHEPFVNRHVFDEAAFSLFLIADHRAIAPVYGEQARDFCLFEAGYMSQLLMMTAPDCHLGLCPIGKMDFDRIAHHFDLDPQHEYLHSFLGGTPAASEAVRVAMPDKLRRLLAGVVSLSGEEVHIMLQAHREVTAEEVVS
jgi:SagB-type dehydrogenase family enzyme